MRTTRRRSALRHGVIAAALLAGLQVAPALAAPITLRLSRRLTEVCDTFPARVGTCTPDNTLVRFAITYDPDTLVLDVSRPDHPTLRTPVPPEYTISLPRLDDPWGGPITRTGQASAEFEGDPIGSRRASGAKILDADFLPGCTAGGQCDRSWLTSLEFGNFFRGDPIGTPGPDDFAAALRHSGGPGSWFLFMTVASYTPAGGGDRVTLPESRLYYSAVPEPAAAGLVLVALAAAGLRRRRMSARR